MSETIPFKPYAYYSKESKTFTHYVKGDPDYSEVLADGTTVYRSLETGEIVGVRINVEIPPVDVEGMADLLEAYSLVKTDDDQPK